MRKIDYQNTIDELKKRELIKPGDKYLVAVFRTETKTNGIVNTVITSNYDYILVVNRSELTLYDINKKNGEYLDSYITFKKEDLVFEKKNKNWILAQKGWFGSRYITIRADYMDKFSHAYIFPKKIHGYIQKEKIPEVFDFIKEVYNTHYDEVKREYKENKKK